MMAYIRKENFLKDCAKTFGNPSLTIKAIAEIAERNTVEAAESAVVETELDCTIADDLINRQKAEIERLDKLVIYNASCCTRLHKELFNAKSEAIKVFAERLKKEALPEDGCGWDCVYVKDIDKLVAEMAGEDNG